MQNLINIPWFEKKSAKIYLNKKKFKNDLNINARHFIENGYVILKNIVDDAQIKKTIIEFNSILKSKKYKTNPKYFHYNKNPRIIEGWKISNTIKSNSLNKKILMFLKKMYESKPIAVSTINFKKGTEQPLHSDYMHFASKPDLYLAGCWIALENINENNGPLIVIPQSHKLKKINLDTLDLEIPSTSKEIKKNYTIYENYVKKIIKVKNLKKKKILMNKGDAIIWAANLLHGGGKIINKRSTRFSQVTHYHFQNLKKIYNPCFTKEKLKKFGIRDINKIKII